MNVHEPFRILLFRLNWIIKFKQEWCISKFQSVRWSIPILFHSIQFPCAKKCLRISSNMEEIIVEYFNYTHFFFWYEIGENGNKEICFSTIKQRPGSWCLALVRPSKASARLASQPGWHWTQPAMARLHLSQTLGRWWLDLLRLDLARSTWKSICRFPSSVNPMTWDGYGWQVPFDLGPWTCNRLLQWTPNIICLSAISLERQWQMTKRWGLEMSINVRCNVYIDHLWLIIYRADRLDMAYGTPLWCGWLSRQLRVFIWIQKLMDLLFTPSPLREGKCKEFLSLIRRKIEFPSWTRIGSTRVGKFAIAWSQDHTDLVLFFISIFRWNP